MRKNLLAAAIALPLLLSLALAQTNNFNILDGSGKVAPAPVAISVTASPFVYTNPGSTNGFVVVFGGTVSLIEISQAGSAFTSDGSTSGQYALAPNDQLRVTYSAAPAMTFFGTP